jgi:hypothetical protein
LAARHKKIYSLFGFRWFRRRGHASSNIWGGTALQIIACGMDRLVTDRLDVVRAPNRTTWLGLEFGSGGSGAARRCRPNTLLIRRILLPPSTKKIYDVGWFILN